MNNRGASLIATIFILVILALLGAALCVLVATDADTSVQEIRSDQALCLAESGIDRGLWTLHGDFDRTWAPDPAVEHVLGSGSFTLELTSNPDGTEVLRATGYVPAGSTAEASRAVEVEGDLVPEPRHPFFAHALWFGSLAELDYSRHVVTASGTPSGDMHVDGDIVFSNGAGRKIDGAVRSTGTVTSASWSGDDPWRSREENVDEIPFPPLGDPAEEWCRGNAYSVLTGDQTISSDLNLANGRLYFIEGNLTITGAIQVSGNGAFVASGDITITGTMAYRKKNDGPLALIAFGDIHCNQDTDPLNASLYAAGAIRVSSPSTIVILGNLGSEGGMSVADGTSIGVTFDKRLGSWSAAEKILPTAPSRAFVWREVY